MPAHSPVMGVLVECSRHRKRCGLAAGSQLRIAHPDGGYCDSQVFIVTERSQVDPDGAWAELLREQVNAEARAAAGERTP